MFRARTKNLLESAQEQSVVEFANRFSNQKEEVTVKNAMGEDASVLVVVDLNDETTKSLLFEYRYPLKRATDATIYSSSQQFAHAADSLINEVSRNMISIDEYLPFNDCLNTLYQLKKDLGEDLYGAFMVDQIGQKFNPLHPLTALELMDNKERRSKKYKMYVYSFSDNMKTTEDRCLRSDYARIPDNGLIEKNIAAQIAIYSQKHTMVQKLLVNVRQADLLTDFRGRSEPHYIVDTITSNSKDVSHPDTAFMIPHNILNNGITIPYYGTSIVNMTRSQGHQCSPMMSANIGFGSSFLSNKSYQAYNICTGNVSKTILSGIKTLNHSNLTSPLSSLIIQPGWRDYVDHCIDYSFMAYESILEGYSAEFSDTFLEPKFETFMEEFFYINPEASMVDYLKSVALKAKSKVKETAAPVAQPVSVPVAPTAMDRNVPF